MAVIRVDIRSKSDHKKSEKRPYYYFIDHGDFDIIWPAVGIFLLGHVLTFYAFFVIYTERPCKTFFFMNFVIFLVSLGVTIGAHRLWAHKSYQARLPLKLLLAFIQTLAGQNPIFTWATSHRTHHKWSDTDGDPHNTKRGYFFTHCGWLLRTKHPELGLKMETLDFSDLENDPIVYYQKMFYLPLNALITLFLPVWIPTYFWGETWTTSFLLMYIVRYVLTLHVAWFVNSAAHMWGDKPYSVKNASVENVHVSFVAYGEGYHNYHHSFPSDYQASELGQGLNVGKHVLDLFAAMGQAYNLKVTSKAIIAATKARVEVMSERKKFGHGHFEYEGEYDFADGQLSL